MTKEIWKPIVGFEKFYEVSNMGHVRKLTDERQRKKGYILKGSDTKGYVKVAFCRNGMAKVSGVHRLVLEAFVGSCSKGMEASHLNDIKTDNRLKNLAWMTRSENAKLAFEHGRIHPMKGKHHSKKAKRKISQALIGNQNRKGKFK